MKFLSKKLIIPVVALVLASLMCVGSVFAWFFLGDYFGTLTFKIAKINSKVTLYQVKDGNYNGVPDVDSDGNYLLFDGSGEYNEIEIITTGENADDNMTITVPGHYSTVHSGIYPTEVFTYMVRIENKGEADNELSFSFLAMGVNFSDCSEITQTPTAGQYSADYLKTLSVRIGYDESGDGSVVYGAKKLFANGITTNLFTGFTLSEGINIIGAPYATGTNVGKNIMDFYIQFRFEINSELTDGVNESGNKLSDVFYASAEGKAVTLPLLKINLEV